MIEFTGIEGRTILLCLEFTNLPQSELQKSARMAGLHWTTKILSHKEKCLFLIYFWMLNSNMFPEFFCHPHLFCCIRLCESTSLHTRHWGPVGGSLDI